MLKTVLATIRENGLIAPGNAVVVGLSGGPDSVALFHVLLRLRERLSFSLSAAHLNHKLRGRDSDQDERFVRALVKRNGVALVAESRDVKAIRDKRGGSIEEIAREVRYAFLRKAAEKVGAKKIALGHTMDDNAETILINLIRGSGLRGLSGIPVSRTDGEFLIIRPLLEVSRGDILAYLKRERLRYREDVSNLDTSLTRNRIRHQLIPLLAKEYNPRLEKVLAETGRNLRDAEESLSAAMAELEKECVRSAREKLSVNLNSLRPHSPALWRELFRRLLQQRFNMSVKRGTLEQICQLVAGTRTESLGLGKGLVACREYDELVFLSEPKRKPAPFQKELRIPCEIFLSQLGVQISASFAKRKHVPIRRERRPPIGEAWREVRQGEMPRFEEYFDASAIGGDTIVVRTRKEGDRLRPAGMKGSRKVKELFIDEKVPATLRDRIPIFSSGDEIMWIVGYSPAARFAAGSSTEKVLRLVVKLLYCEK
jgi:tRNA(Ile)-lysidine synthase